MLVDNGDGTYMAGPADVLLVMQDVSTGRFHASFWEESPMPGPVEPVEEAPLIRLKSRMHHTGGADTYEEALTHLKDLAEQIRVPDSNYWPEAGKAVAYDFAQDGYAHVLCLPNWLKSGE